MTVTGTTVFALLLKEHLGLEGGLYTVLLLSPLLLLFGGTPPKHPEATTDEQAGAA